MGLIHMSDAVGTREQLLEAAGRLFADTGFERTTIRDICEQVGANVAAVNYHFGDKARLYRAAVQLAYRSRAGEVPLPEWRVEDPPARRLYGMVRTLLERMLGQSEIPWQSRLLMREILRPTSAYEDVVREYFEPLLGLLQSLLDELVPAETSTVARRQLAFSVIGQCLFYRVSNAAVALMLPESERAEHFHLDALADHITRVTLAAAGCTTDFLQSPPTWPLPPRACSTHTSPNGIRGEGSS